MGGKVNTAQGMSAMRAWLVALMLLILGAGLPATAQDASFSPRLYVNDRVISNYEVDQRARFLQLLRAPGDPEEEAIKALIEDRLRSSVAEGAGLSLTAEAVTVGMNEFASRANLTGEQFVEALAQAGVAAETFRDFVSAGLIWRDVVRAKFGGRVTISDAEIDRAIARSKQATTARLLLSEVVIPGSEGLAIVERLKREKSTLTAFTAAARRYSKAPSAENGGQLDWLPLANLPADVRAAVIGLEKGAISDPVRVPGGIAAFFLRDIAQDPTPELAPIEVKYAQYLIPNDGASAAALRASVDVCDDLYAVAKGQPEDRLMVETVPLGQVPAAIGAELANLDPGESSTAIKRGEWQVFLMLCSRTPVQELAPQRDDIRTQLINQQLGGYAERVSGRTAGRSDYPRAVMRPIALTCGEPAGIGPEIAVAARRILQGEVPFFWIGDPRHLPEGSAFQVIDAVDQVGQVPDDVLPVLAHEFAGIGAAGTPVLANARGVIEVIARAVDLVMTGEASAVCTAPINKKALKDGANFGYPGHTEYLAALAGVGEVVMMLACPDLRVVPATIHIPLAEVPAALTATKLEAVIRLTRAGLMRDFGIENPRLAVAGLNPHAGEGGAIGIEERDMIIPLLDRLRAEGFHLQGPMPADTMFHAGARAHYDAAVCMYHDQALIPIKTIDFAGGVNVTLGLPFIRTSPDHGTAFDIAGKGVADPTSLVAALRMAADMARARA